MIYKFLPNAIFSRLFGDRRKFGLVTQVDDSCWKQWEKTYVTFYTENQRKGVGHVVNESGYKILQKVNLKGKKILEIGPGGLPHLHYLSPEIGEYNLVDINDEMLTIASERLQSKSIPYRCTKIEKGNSILPFEDSSFDIVVSFFSLEHIYPLEPYIRELHRVLRPEGLLVGAVPSEGGAAWGLGRYLTSRRWFLKNTSINPDKIICWEHPNFINTIVKTLRTCFQQKKLSFWPFPFLRFFDVNLVVRFVFEKK